MKTRIFALIIVAALLALAGCSNSSLASSGVTSSLQLETTPPVSSSSISSSASSEEQREPSEVSQSKETEKSEVLNSGYDEIANRYTDSEMAVIFPSDKTEINIHLVEQWALDYQNGTPSMLPVYWFGIASPSIMLIESNGNSQYTMDIYSRDGPPLQYTSGYLVERKYDYVFGADFPAEIHPIPILKKLGGDNGYEWDGKTALGSLSLDDIVEKAKDISTRVTTYAQYNQGIRGSGIYLSDNIMSAATPYESHRIYKIQEVREKDGDLFYIVAGYDDKTQQISLDRIVISADGTNAFLVDEEGGGWIYCYDENERIIAPNRD